MRVGLGIPTFNRPEALAVCTKSIAVHLGASVDDLFIYNDGSDAEYRPAYESIYADVGERWTVTHAEENRAVAAAKNHLLHSMMEAGDDLLILCEDDMQVMSPDAVRVYQDAIRPDWVEHLNFGPATPLNEGPPVGEFEGLPLYPHVAGCWSVFTRRCIETVGYMDEHLVNAWEHVDYTYRLGLVGLTTPFWTFADAPGAEKVLRVQSVPSAIGPCSAHDRRWTVEDAHRRKAVVEGLRYLADVGRCPPGLELS